MNRTDCPNCGVHCICTTVAMVGDSIIERAPWDIANFGRSSERTAGLLKRLPDIINAAPSAVFIMVGINDIRAYVPVRDIVTRYKQIIERLLGSGIEVYIIQPLPVRGDFFYANIGRNELAAEIERFSAEYRNVTVIAPKMADRFGELAEEFSADGVHLSKLGYQVLYETIIPYING